MFGTDEGSQARRRARGWRPLARAASGSRAGICRCCRTPHATGQNNAAEGSSRKPEECLHAWPRESQP
eukprot:5841212-Pyramimonas_sp.AAC.1